MIDLYTSIVKRGRAMLSLLTECTVLMLRVIHEMYREQRITYEEFRNFTKVKIQFLLENLNSISTEAERRKATDIINKCTSLISQNNTEHMMNVICFNSDILQ